MNRQTVPGCLCGCSFAGVFKGVTEDGSAITGIPLMFSVCGVATCGLVGAASDSRDLYSRHFNPHSSFDIARSVLTRLPQEFKTDMADEALVISGNAKKQ